MKFKTRSLLVLDQIQEYKKLTGRGAGGNYSGFGDVFRAGSVDNSPVPGPGYWPGPGPVDNVYYHQHQQANMMANRLQQMAMEENNARYRSGNGGGGRRYPDYDEDVEAGGVVDYGNLDRGGSGMKRQMNSQGGNRGKKNRGGWNR